MIKKRKEKNSTHVFLRCVHPRASGLLKDCVGGHSYALKMRSSLLLIYVTHAVTYTLVISPTSPLTA